MYLLGLDIGTIGSKAFLYTVGGKIISSAYGNYSLYHPKPELSELKPQEVWSIITFVTRECIQQSKVDPTDIKALSISAFGHSIMPVDRDANPVFRCIQAYDNRAAKEGQELQERLGERIYEITDNQQVNYFPIAKILWLRGHAPEVYAKTDKFVGWHEFTVWRLCGEPIIDYSLAECTGLFDIEKREWSRELLDEIDVEVDLMPRSEIAGTQIGATCSEEAQKMGFSKKTAVVVGGHDIAISAIGAGAITPGIWMDLTGTYEFIRAPLSSKDKTRRLLCGGIRNSMDIPVLGGKIDTSGALFRWFRDNFGHEEFVESQKTGADPYDLLTQRASKANLGSDDLLFIPDFRNARGAFIGLTLKHKKNEFIRAILEGLTFELRHVFELLEQQGVEAKEIRAIGGGAKSAFWLQLKADITKKTIIRPVIIECGSLGAAILAGIGVDVYSGVEDGFKVTYQIKDAYEPRKDRSEKYDALYQKYLRIRAEINTLYERMMPLG